MRAKATDQYVDYLIVASVHVDFTSQLWYAGAKLTTCLLVCELREHFYACCARHVICARHICNAVLLLRSIPTAISCTRVGVHVAVAPGDKAACLR